MVIQFHRAELIEPYNKDRKETNEESGLDKKSLKRRLEKQFSDVEATK